MRATGAAWKIGEMPIVVVDHEGVGDAQRFAGLGAIARSELSRRHRHMSDERRAELTLADNPALAIRALFPDRETSETSKVTKPVCSLRFSQLPLNPIPKQARVSSPGPGTIFFFFLRGG